MDVGRFEWLLETNQRMHQLLQERGANVTYREYAAGHNYYAWRDEAEDGLRWAFGG
jgi:enterochelin esterase family protein